MATPTKLHPEIPPCPGTRVIDVNRGNLQASLDGLRSGDRLLLADDDYRGKTWVLGNKVLSPPASIEPKVPSVKLRFGNSNSGGGSQTPWWIHDIDGLHLVGFSIVDPTDKADCMKLDAARNVRVFKCSFQDAFVQGLINRYSGDLIWIDSCYFRNCGVGDWPVGDPWKQQEGVHSMYLGSSHSGPSTRFVVVNNLIEDQVKGSGPSAYCRNSIFAYNTFVRMTCRAVGGDAGMGILVWGNGNVDNVASSNLFLDSYQGIAASGWDGKILVDAGHNAFHDVEVPMRIRYGNYATVRDTGSNVYLQDGWTRAELQGKGNLAFQPRLDYDGNVRSGGTIGHLQGITVVPPDPPLTNTEIVDAAWAELMTTRISGVTWADRVANGYKGKPYDGSKTAWGRAKALLDKVKD